MRSSATHHHRDHHYRHLLVVAGASCSWVAAEMLPTHLHGWVNDLAAVGCLCFEQALLAMMLTTLSYFGLEQ
jgi:hypothetical protein